MKPRLRVLIVDDSADDAELLVLQLTRGGYDVVSLRVDTADALQAALAEGGWQIILCDFSMPRFSGEAALRLVRTSGLDLPFIFVSGTMGEEVAVGAVKAGADDYVMKDRLARLVPAVTRELREAEDRRRRRRAEEALQANAARLLQQEAALIALSRRKASDDDVLTSLRRITEVSSRTLAVARVSVWRYNADHPAMRCIDLYELAADRHSSGIELAVAELPRYIQSLAQDDAIAANDVHEEPRFAELVERYLKPLGITSMMEASVPADGVPRGVVCFEHVGTPRQWTLDERTFAVATANLVALVLEEWEHKEAEEALRGSEQRFRQVTENIDEVFWLTDAQKNEMIYISPAYSRVWGRTCESLTADPHSWIEAIHPEDRERVREAARLQTTGGYDLEYRIVRPDGSERWVHDRAFPIRDAENRVYRLAGVAEDTTRRRQLEDQLRQSQKMEAIGQLAGGVAHDFNNLLAVIQMASSVLLTRPATPAEMQDGLQQILAVSEQAANLTRQLLTFSRRSVRQARDVDLAEVIGGMAKLLRRILGEDLALETRIAHALPLVNADPGMMEQVLMNLAVNARDAMPKGGRLLISLDAVEIGADDSARRAHAMPGGFARLLVQDTGSGIAPQDIPHIFEPFFTTKDAGKGTGLGLATVFGIVEQHHGWIDVTSDLGRGTTFEIFLPALPSSHAISRSERPALQFPRGTESILLVEDEPTVRRLVRLSLEHCGYRVHEADSPGKALALWETLPESVDLLFTDLIMPGGMTGRELAERLIERQPGLKVIYSSGYSHEVVRRELQLTPGYNFLQKPYHLAEMAATVRRCLDER